MGNYLNSRKPSALFKSEQAKPYFVDKSGMLKELFSLVEAGSSYVCVTRPRRFGKTFIANMIAAFFEKGRKSNELFECLEIAKTEGYKKYLNSQNVIYITFNEIPRDCCSYRQYIERIEERLAKELVLKYPDYVTDPKEALWDILNDIFEVEGTRFLFVLDEWDYIFHREFVTAEEKITYIDFLSSLLKGQPYVSLAYMTGILPIAKYSSGSELNMFLEYTMVSEERFNSYFGFTDDEVDELYRRYLNIQEKPEVTREGLRYWYDGYCTKSGHRIYNPRSVVASLTNNNLGNYWTSSGPYDEIFCYIDKNVDEVRDGLALMVSGIPIPAKVREYAAVSMNLQTKDEIFSAMVVYGFLSYQNGCVSIPNKELMNKFAEMLQREPSLGYIYRLTNASERMLKATRQGDTMTMLEILEYAHDTEIPLLSYSNEADLTAVVNLVYLSARDFYHIEREDKAGIGYVDFIFYPVVDKGAECMILELKVDGTPQEAIQQIKDRKYALRFLPKLGKKPVYTGKILAVGISYSKKDKKHDCKVEVLNMG